METLDGTEWDVVIAGTGLPQSLLALSLSRSGKSVLHLDRNDYYGGNEAALSLSEARDWATKHAATGEEAHNTTFSHATIQENAVEEGGIKLSQPRAYSLALAPHVIHAQSKLLAALVSSRMHNQLEFQAVGSWFLAEPLSENDGSRSNITRVPSGREDIFRDNTFDLRAKRSLMKFLRFVQNYEEQPEAWESDAERPFPDFLQQKFGLPPSSHGALLSLTLLPSAANSTWTGSALPLIARHLRSIGVFGPGFGAVLPKWGGLAEIAQVACRAGAVGGGVYVLKKGIDSISSASEDHIKLVLSDGEKITTRWLAGCSDDLPSIGTRETTGRMTRSISIVTPPLVQLFPPTSEGGVTPAGAVVIVPSSTADEPPVQIVAHSHESGECPSTQSVLYGSVALPYEQGKTRLAAAVEAVLQGHEESSHHSLWSLCYHQNNVQEERGPSTNTIVLAHAPLELGLSDSTFDEVKLAWQQITGETEGFMVFEAREGMEDDD